MELPIILLSLAFSKEKVWVFFKLDERFWAFVAGDALGLRCLVMNFIIYQKKKKGKKIIVHVRVCITKSHRLGLTHLQFIPGLRQVRDWPSHGCYPVLSCKQVHLVWAKAYPTTNYLDKKKIWRVKTFKLKRNIFFVFLIIASTWELVTIYTIITKLSRD